MYDIQQSTTAFPLLFYMVATSDHIAGLTGGSPTVTIRKVGGSFASPSGSVTEIANGWYQVAGNATDSNTLGPLLLHATVASGDPCDVCYRVVSYNPQDAVRLGLTALPNAAAEAAGGLYTRGSGAGQINQPANGRVDANTIAVSGTTQTARDLGASVLLSPGTGTGQISITSGALTVGTNNDKTGYTASTVSDKTGYALTSGEHTAVAADVLDATASGHNTAGTIGAKINTAASAGSDPLLNTVPGSYGAGTAGAALGRVPSSPAAIGSAMTLDLTQAVPTSNTAQTVGDAFNAARAQGFGRWVLSGTTLTLYAGNGTTVVRTFTLDSATVPTSRT